MTRRELAAKLSKFLQTDQLETERDANKIAHRFARLMKQLGFVTEGALDEASDADKEAN